MLGASRLTPPAPRSTTDAALRWLLVGQFLMFVGIAAAFPIAPLYVRHHGGGAVAAALFIAGALVANSVVQIPAGWLVDRVGRRPVLLASRSVYAVVALSIFALDTVAPLWVLATLRTLQGAAAGAYIPALLAIIGDLSTPERRAERFSQLQAAEMGGLLVGPLLGGIAALWTDSAIFLCAGVLVAAGVLAQRNVPETRTQAPREQAVAAAVHGWWRSRGVVIACLGLATLGGLFAMYDVTWPQYLAARGAGSVLIGVSITLFAVPLLLLATRGGRFADRHDRRLILGITMGLTGLCCATYPALRSIPVILVLGTVEATAVVMCEPTLYATITEAAPLAVRGRAMGMGGFFQLGGSGAGAALLGSAYGLREGIPFWLAGGGMVLTAVLCSILLPARLATAEGRRSVAAAAAGALSARGAEAGEASPATIVAAAQSRRAAGDDPAAAVDRPRADDALGHSVAAATTDSHRD